LPTDDAKRREKDVVNLCAHWLPGAEVEGYPEDDDPPGRFPIDLTVDGALATVHGLSRQLWSIDVMTLAWHANLIPTSHGVEAALRPGLDELAKLHNAAIKVEFWPVPITPVGKIDPEYCRFDQVKKEAQAILKWVSEELRVRSHSIRVFADVQVRIKPRDEDPWDLPPGEGRVIFAPYLGRNPRSLDELRSSLTKSLTKKLSRQFPRAKSYGHKTILALDAIGASDLRFGANDAVDSGTVSQFLQESLRAATEGVLDVCLYVGRDGISFLHGNWPEIPAQYCRRTS
jgi:hypothetical protein